MSGVEILSTKEIITETTFNTTTFWIAMVITVVVFIILGIIGVKYDGMGYAFVPAMFALGVIVGVILGSICGDINATPTEYKTRYKVTISDDVSMNDFVDKYKIISQEGKIFTVEEKVE